MIWKHKQLQEALSCSIEIAEDFGQVQFNSKDINKGDIFIALDIGKGDGHDFVADAVGRGASIAIVSKDVKEVGQDRIIRVSDTYQALCLLAEYKRMHSKAKFIGITGSVGKTSTKQALGMMLKPYGKVFVSRGNFNNHIGVPINLASMPDDIEYAVIEMGMSAAGELSELTKLVTPDVAVITSIAEGHLAFFKSVEEINDAKCEIFQGLKISSGIAVINHDIPTYQRCVDNIDRMGIHNVQTFGKHQDAYIKFISYEMLDEELVRLNYLVRNEEIEIIMPTISEHLASNFAACFATVRALGLDVGAASEAIAHFSPQAGRGAVVSIAKNDKQYQIICDYYNSNPESLRAGLKYLGQFDHQNKIAIIGDMKELGVDEIKMHKAMAPYIVDSGVSKVILVGKLMSNIQEELPQEIKSICYSDVNHLIDHVDELLHGDEMILIKGSRSMNLDKVAEYLGVKNAL